MVTIIKIAIIGSLLWGYFACIQGLSVKALTQLNNIKQMYNIENIQASLADSK